ncbi:protein DGCR14 [Copidosoma floridanum]|uniref:protein DGCR14 n=1 Tax=Copidosoma floridanum TaxID=29053 RepID=UPI0006C95539|nr:protein DGCR14 [Copidosoma floridanum]
MFSPLTLSSPSMSSPGSVALETAKSLKDQVTFKVPTAPAKRSRARVLDEESYIEKVGEIIQRDFFPDLEKLKAQTEYIEAQEHNDIKKMRQLYEKYSFGRPRPERLPSPATFETPVSKGNVEEDEESVAADAASEAKQDKSEERKVGLDEFLSNNTSEDNASFEDILVESDKKHRLKYAWLYKPESEPQLAIENSKLLAIENGSAKRPFAIDTWSYKNKNYIMYIPDGVELTAEEKIEFAKRRQEVVHSNTRLKINPFNEQQNKETISELAKIQSKTNDGKIGIDGKEILKNETPNVNGYTFVATPSLSPSPMPSPMPEDILGSPIMTWGFIDGTPFRLDGGDTPVVHVSQGPSFRMAEPPKREKIALQLAEKAGERNRDKKMKALNAARRSLATPSPSPRSTIDRLNTMSPAARRFATQKLRVTVSPSPNRSPSVRTPLLGVRTPNTPRSGTSCMKIGGNDIGLKPQMPILTDNLLKLPQRQRAADFFND